MTVALERRPDPRRSAGEWGLAHCDVECQVWRPPTLSRYAFETKAILFCDESGNSGSNYYDRTQPVHVHAGWLVRDDQRDGYARLCVELREGRAGQKESKSNRLVGSKSGARLIRAFVDSALELGVVPLVALAEKRFCVAAKIVETYLDPTNNPAAAWLPTTADLTRPRLATLLLDQLPESVLAGFANAYKKPTVDGLRNSLQQVVRALAHIPRLAATLRAVDVTQVFADDFSVGPGATFKHNLVISLNVMALVPLLIHADDIAIARGVDGVEAIHDECIEFEPTYQRVLQMLKTAGDQRPPFDVESGPAPKMGVTHIGTLTTRKSTEEVCLQGADVLAGLTRVVADASLAGREVEEDVAAAARTLGAASNASAADVFLIGSLPFAKSFIGRVGIEA